MDSEINHKRCFIKISFINKGMDFINLSSIFRDNSVSSIPTYFQNTGTPIICHKFNNSVRSIIFNLNKYLFQVSILIQILPIPEIVKTQCIAIQ